MWKWNFRRLYLINYEIYPFVSGIFIRDGSLQVQFQSNSGTFATGTSGIDFLGQLVWSLTLTVGTSSLCHNVQRRLPDGLGSSLGKRWSKQQMRDYWINLEGDINALEPRALCNTYLLFPFYQKRKNRCVDKRDFPRSLWKWRLQDFSSEEEGI